MAVSVAIAGPVRLSAGTQPRVSTGTYLHVDLTTQVALIADSRLLIVTALRDGKDREQGCRGRRSALSRGGTGRRGNVDEPLEEFVERGLTVVDGGAFVVRLLGGMFVHLITPSRP